MAQISHGIAEAVATDAAYALTVADVLALDADDPASLDALDRFAEELAAEGLARAAPSRVRMASARHPARIGSGTARSLQFVAASQVVKDGDACCPVRRRHRPKLLAALFGIVVVDQQAVLSKP